MSTASASLPSNTHSMHNNPSIWEPGEGVSRLSGEGSHFPFGGLTTLFGGVLGPFWGVSRPFLGAVLRPFLGWVSRSFFGGSHVPFLEGSNFPFCPPISQGNGENMGMRRSQYYYPLSL